MASAGAQHGLVRRTHPPRSASVRDRLDTFQMASYSVALFQAEDAIVQRLGRIEPRLAWDILG